MYIVAVGMDLNNFSEASQDLTLTLTKISLILPKAFVP